MKMGVGMTKKENNREHIVLHKVRDKDGADKSAPYIRKYKSCEGSILSFVFLFWLYTRYSILDTVFLYAKRCTLYAN